MPYRNVLGIALYAAGDYQASLDVLEDNIRRGGPEGPHMDVFRAAAHAQLGQDDAARNLLDDMARSYKEEGQPFFLTTQFWAPHGPYLPSPEFVGTHDRDAISQPANWPDDYDGNPRRYHRFVRS